MSNKIPCGGFKLDNNFLGMNENDELSLTGGSEGEGKAYKQLVTDGTGTATWEDRLAYGVSRLVIATGGGAQLVKVTDEIPSWASVDSPMKIWMSNGNNVTVNPEGYNDLGNGSFNARRIVLFIATDNIEFNGVVFPEKGVYFVQTPDFYISGIASADSDTPEITWDGSVEILKKIDSKYTGLLAFSILWDGTSNYSATASYQEVRDAYDAKIPIFANLFVNNTCYPATEIMAFDNYLSFGCGTYGVSYSSDGTIGKTDPR